MTIKLRFNQSHARQSSIASLPGRSPRLAFATIATASLLCFAHSASAAPGTPSLRQYEITSKPHGFVEIDLQRAGAAPYKDLVKLNKKVDVPLPFDIWSNGTAVKAVAVVDGTIDSASEIKLTPGGAQRGTVVANVKTAGVKKFQVRVFDADGASADSAPLDVTVFDTIPELADTLPDNASKTNKPFAKDKDSVVAAYFATWSIYDRKFSVDNVPVENLTHLLYAFVPICGGENINGSLAHDGPNAFRALQQTCRGLPDYSVAIHDTWGEIGVTLPGQTANSPLKGVLGQMMAAKKRNPDLKILPSIGGWTLSDPFFQMHDPAKRKVFIDSTEQLLRTWKFFDGVDIDWEFPGGKGANPALGNPATDGALYVTLIKELRQMLDRLSAETGKTYELTSAIGSGRDKIGVVNYKEASKYMNYVFDMSYDFYGAFSLTNLGHQTALYAPAWRPDTDYTADNSVAALLAQGVDSKKLVLGAAMYGRGWTGVSGYSDGNPFSGTATGPVPGSWEPGVVDYKAIASKMVGPNNAGINGYEYHYDQTAEAPYVFNKSTGELVTFDDARSVLAKGDYVRKHQLGGLFAWEIDADNGDILNAMHEGLGHDQGGTHNHAPIANAGTDMTVTGPATVTLDASKSHDPDKDALSYRWEQTGGAPLTISHPDGVKATVAIPAVQQDTRFVFRVTVTDTAGLKSSAQMAVTAKADASVKPPPAENRPPVARLTGPAEANGGQSVTLSAAQSTDPDGDPLTFQWTVPAGITAQPSGATLNFTAPKLAKDQSFTFAVKASDGKLSSSAQHTIRVKAADAGHGGAGNGGESGGGSGGAGGSGSAGSAGGAGGAGGDYPAYQSGSQYKAGDVVSNLGKLFQCKPFPYSGWCSMAPAAYEPGKGFAWSDAWTSFGGGAGGNGGSGGAGNPGHEGSTGGSGGTGNPGHEGSTGGSGGTGNPGHEGSTGGSGGTGNPGHEGGTGGSGGAGNPGNEAGTHPQYKEGTRYAAGDIVSNRGALYRCKPFPYTNWCSMAAWAYEPGKGSAWAQAWDKYAD
ncbi:glycosyl hydrolase family 18 protein [Burkholderia sp. 22PA0099]|uniref:glycosyl hydrolase family 18 protein n=1 Tax=Burkholderia sp. 22PA0099 TaxID=3237372 RepID=UPI0039C11F06